MKQVRKLHPDWDPAPFQRRLRALLLEGHKYLWSSRGDHALFDLGSDPSEQRDRIPDRPDLARRLEGVLATRVASLAACFRDGQPAPEPSPDERELLEGLGYAVPATD